MIEAIFAAGDVVDARGRSLDADASTVSLSQGVWIYRPIPDEPSSAIEVEVLARGEGWLIADKPHDLATMPRGRFVARTLTVALRRQEGNDDIVFAHRLDRATAGVVLATSDPAKRGMYQQMFSCGEVKKRYLAVTGLPAGEEVAGVQSQTALDLDSAGALDVSWFAARTHDNVGVSGGVDERGPYLCVTSRIEKRGTRVFNEAGEPNSQTIMRPAAGLVPEASGPGCGAGLQVWEVEPVTGRTHQIRAHFFGVGTPIVGDPLYGGQFAARYGLDETPLGFAHLQLLAKNLEFTDPQTGEVVSVSSRRGLEFAKAGQGQAVRPR
ncbi:pseudouridine synthase [Actinomyces urinae]|uniref:pseudouridine synthase n=1 Tax=Actinomyces urinae TaxID=1689268 RepID=UPI0018A82D66|nr:pseudouridine synthase [Actinomyces urinae]